jgi:hypothetical protein
MMPHRRQFRRLSWYSASRIAARFARISGRGGSSLRPDGDCAAVLGRLIDIELNESGYRDGAAEDLRAA